MRRAWILIGLAAALLVQGCGYNRCCYRRSMFRPCYRRACATSSVCCHGGEVVAPVPLPPPMVVVPPAPPLPPGAGPQPLPVGTPYGR